MNEHFMYANNYITLKKKLNEFFEQVNLQKMGTKFFEIVKWKLSLGAIIIQKGGRKKYSQADFWLTEGKEF